MNTTAEILAPFRSMTHVIAEARAAEFKKYPGLLAFRRDFETVFKQQEVRK